ncbi:MAG: MG2 domain-containing protein [Flavobacteriales bacterium]|nr:MG2 domain-containing protein [Flavobacteriales bacterium]
MKKLIPLFLISFLVACSGSKDGAQAEKVQINPEFSEYISAFTGGVIPSDGAIKVQFNEEMPKDAREREDLEDIFVLYPEAEGDVSWVDDRTLQFTPEEALNSGTLYKASVEISELMDVKDGLETFEFNFRTQRKSFQFEIERFTSYSSSDFSKQKMIGKLTFSEKVDSNAVKKMVTATQDGRDLKIQTIQENQQNYHFVIHNIERKTSRSTLYVEWNGDPVGIEKSGNKSIKIPRKDEFVVMDVEVNHAPEQFVRVHFSDPLEQNQFLEGLIYLQDNDVSIVADDQVVLLYPNERIVGYDKIKIAQGVRNVNNKKLTASTSMSLHFDDIAPDFELLGEGNIVPRAGKAHFPFSAINLTAVDITITKIFEENVIQFLQVNSYDGTYQLRRVGREVHEERVELDPEGQMNLHDWNNFSIDLSKYVDMDPGAIYRVELSARKEYSLYDCNAGKTIDEELTTFAFTAKDEEWHERDWNDYYYDYDYYYYDYDYDYSDRYDPCSDYFYQNKSISRNVLISDIGIIAKAGSDKKMHVILTDLNSTEPMASANVKFYDYQQQLLGETKTDENGMCDMHLNRKPFVVIAEKDGQKGYLKLNDGESLSLSKFDVSGETVQRGVKGFIYTERGVWRPGDSLYISFMLEDKDDILPASHPVKFEFINPKGIVVDEKIRAHSVNGLYDFRTATDPEAITGNYSARVTIGNRTFYKSLKVESVKPNRLKINMSFDGEMLTQESGRDVNLEVKWLHGAVADGLKTKVDVHLVDTRTQFKKLNGFIFDDPLKDFTAEDKTVFEGNLNSNGKIIFDHGIRLNSAAPGMLKAYFTTKVFEKGGDFSIDRTSVTYSPYSSYTGIRVPEGDMYGGTLVTDEDHYVDIITVNENGKFVNNDVSVKVYKLEWRWWWDSYDNDLASYISRSSTIAMDSKSISTSGGKARYKFHVDKEDWGRYLILVENKESGHTTGKVVYVDWPYYARSSRSSGENSTMLNFSTDKEKYTKGETVKLSIPTPEEGKALISLESGTKIVDKFWVDTKKGETSCEFVTTDEMDPNVFVHVTLLQPYQTTANDMPIRMYGVVPIYVEDPASHLKPVINMPSVLRPETSTTIKVSEKNNKPMSYTLAIVDEGLLDLTNFKTPDPWTHFNAREALGVKTWDMYDYVMGAYGEELDKMLAIGGDADGNGKKAAKANRFKPMVEFLGPFEIDGNSRSHKIDIPNYVGSVRVMVIAGEDNAYGNAEKTVPVRNPLMVLGTLPRVLGPGEDVTLPVNVFAMEKHVKNVSVTVKTNKMFSIQGKSQRSVTFNKIGDKIVNFNLKVAKKIGLGKVTIIASSGKEKAKYEFEIDVRTPNTEQTKTVEKVLNAGESYSDAVDYFGIRGTNQAYLEVSNFPPVDLGRRLDYLIGYPHGCIEQTTSSVFPQLFLSDLMELDGNRQSMIQANVNAGINRIKLFQTSNGGFSYWPGGTYDNEWGTNYAGHFLIEAEKKGYAVPSNLKSRWIKYQKKQAKNWNKANQGTDGAHYDDLTQAYRLFTLALAGKPEIGLMNRLRERNDLSLPARWRLAGAYKLAGQKEIAEKLISGRATFVPEYVELSYTYGSNTRDEAMILETLVLMGKKVEGAELAKKIANRLNQDNWMSTQTTAYALLAVSKFVGVNNAEKKLKFAYTINGQSGSRNSEMTMVSFDLKGKTKNVSVKNTGKGILYVRLITKGVPLGGEEREEAKNVQLTVNYYNMKNQPISVDRMKQGTDFVAEIKVSNPGTRGTLKELALSHIVPSGWEIHNSRMDEYQSNKSSYFTYQDIRDDRLYTYFNLSAGKTKTFRVQLNSAYLGRYYLPGISVEAMYDNTVYSRVRGKWVEVVDQDIIN